MKEKENKTWVFDLDGTICEEKEKGTNFLEFANVKPIYEVVEKMRMLHQKGDKIIISTARHMGTTKGNLGLINARVSKLTIDWLDKYEVPYDEIYFGKPLGDYYVDDKNMSIEDFKNMREEA